MNKLRYIWLLMLCSAQLWAQNPLDLTAQEEERLYRLSQQYRCLVCQNESIADSRAGLADDLRREMATQIEAGKSDQEIHDYLVSRYGHFVSYDPPFNQQTFILWLIPLAVLSILTMIVYRNSQRHVQQEDKQE